MGVSSEWTSTLAHERQTDRAANRNPKGRKESTCRASSSLSVWIIARVWRVSYESGDPRKETKRNANQKRNKGYETLRTLARSAGAVLASHMVDLTRPREDGGASHSASRTTAGGGSASRTLSFLVGFTKYVCK